MKSVIVAIDAGSSSVRATGYEYHGARGDRHGQGGYEDTPPPPPPPSSSSPRPLVTAMEGIVHTIPMQSVVPNTGRVRVREVMRAIDDCIDGVLRLLRESIVPNSGYRVVGVGLSTFVMNLIGVDRSGNPVGDEATLSYACNREDVVRECQELIKKLGPEKLNAMYQRTGAPIHPSYALPQLLAFYNNEQNNSMIKKIEKWQSISTMVIHRWTGRPNIQIPFSFSEASWTGMMEFLSCTWDDEVMDLMEHCNDVYKRLCEDEMDEDMADDLLFNDGADLLPPMVDYDSALPFLVNGIPRYCDDGNKNEYWERWPEFRSASCQLFLGVGDGAAANVGSKCGGRPLPGANDVQRIAVTIGTSAAARVCLPLPRYFDASAYGNRMQVMPPKAKKLKIDIAVPPGLFCYRVDRDRVLLGGALTDGGSVVEWARSLLGLQSKEAFEACSEEVSRLYRENCTLPPRSSSSSSSSGVTMIPFLSGERSTGYRGGARGCISGVTRSTTPADVMYACLESVILRVGRVLQLVNGVSPQQIGGGLGVLVASGAALDRNSLWRQMLADCSSMDVVVDGDSSEGTSRGVAMMMAGSLRQRELGKPVATYNYGAEPLAVAHETKASPAAEDHWRTAMATQESLINAVAPTWSVA